MNKLGQVKTILVCEPSTNTVLPCPSGQALVAQEAYVISSSSSTYFEAISEPWNYAEGAAYWSAAFALILTIYFASRNVGIIASVMNRI